MTYINMRYTIYPGPAAEPVGPIYLRPRTTDALVYMQVWNDQLYRPVMGLRDYKLIIDAGANIGMSALYFSQHHPKAVIVAVEPDEGNFGMLQRNTDTVNCPVYRRVAVGGRLGACVVRDPGIGAFGLRCEAQEGGDVAVWTMHSVLTTYMYPPLRPCLVKMDIEGAEVECLKEPSWLDMVDVLAIELHGPEAEMALTHALHNLSPTRQYRRWTVGETTFVEFI